MATPSAPPWRVTDTMSKPTPKTDEPSFEDAMQRLDEIVAGTYTEALPEYLSE